ncbi:MAG: adenosine deaminase [Candidatus Melainabacteria bacterium]|nr:adenosine deaminase [Candidatus Melainabacteria bacterium]
MLPKAELHVHIEGTFEPELIFAIAERNKVTVPYPNVETLRSAYQFSDLQSFLNLYYAGMNVLKTEQDFFDLAMAYFAKASAQGVVHTELFFDPQAHLARGIPFEVVINGLDQAVRQSKQAHGLSSSLIMCFLRDLSAESAMEVFDLSLAHGDKFVAVGLDSAEVGNPPSKFRTVFDKARAEGFITVAHAGEEGPPEYVWQAINLLKVSRIDHGVRSLEDSKLVETLCDQAIPLTVCPLSNVKLKVFPSMAQHNIKKMLDLGLNATVNSDDPAYFGGYIEDNFAAVRAALKLSKAEEIQLCRNSINAAFIDASEKAQYLSQLEKSVV